MMTDLKEALRYAGVPSPDEALLEQTRLIAERLEKLVRPRWVWTRYNLLKQANAIQLEGTCLTLTGQTAARMLESCNEAVLLAVTLGAEADMLLRTESSRGMDNAVLLDGCCSALVEAGCDLAEKEIAASLPGIFMTDRFSPGYGDLPLSCQRPLLEALNARRRCGIYLTSSCLMLPSKSVTAVIGLSHQKQRARIRGCAYCAFKNECAYRKGGKTCAE